MVSGCGIRKVEGRHHEIKDEKPHEWGWCTRHFAVRCVANAPDAPPAFKSSETNPMRTTARSHAFQETETVKACENRAARRCECSLQVLESCSNELWSISHRRALLATCNTSSASFGKGMPFVWQGVRELSKITLKSRGCRQPPFQPTAFSVQSVSVDASARVWFQRLSGYTPKSNTRNRIPGTCRQTLAPGTTIPLRHQVAQASRCVLHMQAHEPESAMPK
eukprot:1588068-Rhodomonas_salina.2